MSSFENKAASSKVLEVVGVDEIQFIEPGIDNTSIETSQDAELEVQNAIPSKSLNISQVKIESGSLGACEGRKANRGFRFWCIMLSLAATSILSALEGTIVSTALPTIVGHLGGAELFIWTVNGYFLTR